VLPFLSVATIKENMTPEPKTICPGCNHSLRDNEYLLIGNPKRDGMVFVRHGKMSFARYKDVCGGFWARSISIN
jgi:hypothetical protein